MADRKFLERALAAHGETDDRLGKEFAAELGDEVSNDAAAEALKAIALSHLLGAKALLKKAVGARRAAQGFYHLADELAGEAKDD